MYTEADSGTTLSGGDTLERVVQNVWGVRYIDDLVARRLDRRGGGAPDGDWENDTNGLYYALTDALFSVRKLVSETGTLELSIDSSPYGEPLAREPDMERVDFDFDGDCDSFDGLLMLSLLSNNDPRMDLNNDSNVDTLDQLTFYSIQTTVTKAVGVGRGDRDDNFFGLAGYRYDPLAAGGTARLGGGYHQRHRWMSPVLGRWGQRDPMGFVDGASLVCYASSQPITGQDPFGLFVLAVDPIDRSGNWCGAGWGNGQPWPDHDPLPTKDHPDFRPPTNAYDWCCYKHDHDMENCRGSTSTNAEEACCKARGHREFVQCVEDSYQRDSDAGRCIFYPRRDITIIYFSIEAWLAETRYGCNNTPSLEYDDDGHPIPHDPRDCSLEATRFACDLCCTSKYTRGSRLRSNCRANCKQPTDIGRPPHWLPDLEPARIRVR